MFKPTVLKGVFGALALGGLAAPASAVDLNFDYKLGQGDVGTTFATLSVMDNPGGGTYFSLDTDVTGGAGNPGIVELLIGCNGCDGNALTPSVGTWMGAPSTQSGYEWDYSVRFDPAAVAGNSPLTWVGSSAPNSYLETTSGSGPDALAMIQLSGGSEVIDGQNVTSGFYIAAADGGLPPIPEPSTYAMMLAGLGVVGVMLRRRKQQ